MTKSLFVNLAIERIEKIFTDGGVPEAVLDNVKAECVNQLNKLYIIDSNDHAATVGTIEFEHGLYNVICCIHSYEFKSYELTYEERQHERVRAARCVWHQNATDIVNAYK